MSDGEIRSVLWKAGKLRMIDQRRLPAEFSYVDLDTTQDVADSIKQMVVRGAPAIGAAGAFGMAIAAQSSGAISVKSLIEDLIRAKEILDVARPTAVNLSWATDRIVKLATFMAEQHQEIDHIKSCVLEEAKQLANDDITINKTMAKYGAQLVKQNANILHHCNTGSLATVYYGTAIGVIYESHSQKKNIHVWVDETRPRLQGARLTAWELMNANVPMHLIADNAAGHLMSNQKVDVILYGADRCAANGDIANKIGTYQISVLGHENGIPVYPVVPTSTIDLNVQSGDQIVIEERGREEVVNIGHKMIAPKDVPVFNPAFDITPHKYVTAIVTEEGICYPPFDVSLKAVKEKAENRIKLDWQTRRQSYIKKSKL